MTVVAPAGELVADRLTWRPHGRHVPTLREVSLRLAPGERVLLAGASGSGKSTLLRALAGLLDESLGEAAGSVAIAGQPPESLPGSVGLLLQDPQHAVVAEYAGRDSAFGPENRRLERADVCRRAAGALDAVGFPYGADRRSYDLSGGELARLALAGALALDPQVLLLDEPTAMLDATSAASVRTAVQDAAAEGLTVVIAEHHLEGWLDICDRLVVLERGTVLADGPVAQVLRDQREVLLEAGVWVPGAPEPTPVVPVVDAPTGDATDARLRLVGVAIDDPSGRRLADGLDLELRGGAGLAVVGPSGAGKSTLLRTTAGLVPPAAGRVDYGDGSGWRPAAEVARESTALARTLGWVVQHSEQAVTARTVLAEVEATGEAVHHDHPELAAAVHVRAEVLLAQLGLGHLRDADPYQISGGEQRRMVLAAAVAHDPGLLLLDEPTVGQDRHTWAAVSGTVAAARARGSAVVATTHDERFAAQLGATLRLGRAPGAPEPTTLALLADHQVRAVVEPGTPPAGRCNPLAVLAAGLLAAVGSFWVSSSLVGLITLVAGVVLVPLTVRRVRPALLRLVPVGIAALSVGWSTLLFNERGPFTPGSGALAAREVTRILCLVVPGALLVGVLRPSSLADALAQRLHLPHRPVSAAAAALLRIERLFDTWQTMSQIRRVRGLAPGRSLPSRVRHTLSLTLAMLVGVLRSAQQMATSMDARGFAGARVRSFALPSPWGRRDWGLVAVGLALGVLPVLLSRVL